MTAASIPEHIQPTCIADMSTEQIDKLLESIRERRLRAAKHYEEAQAAKALVAEEKARASLEKQLEMCEGNLSRVDKALDALETRVNKIRALRLEIGID